MKIVIKKRIDLDFLGEEYKEGYLVFKSISINEYKNVTKQAKEKGDQEAADFLVSVLKKQFIEGKFPNEAGKLEAVDREDLGQFDLETVIKIFNTFTGQDTPPK